MALFADPIIYMIAYAFGYRRPAYTVAHDKLSLASYRQAAQTVPIVSSYIHAGDQLDRVTGSMCICTYIHICTYMSLLHSVSIPFFA